MIKRLLPVGLAVMALTGTAYSAPDETEVSVALVTVLGEYATSIDAVTLDRCERATGQPGYVCTYRVDECFGEASDSGCGSPNIPRRAVFVGGDNGWLAFDVQYGDDGVEPRIPLAYLGGRLWELNEEWLTGHWNFEGNCENDAGFIFVRGGDYATATSRGRWVLDGQTVDITVTEQAMDGEGTPMESIAEPIEIRWTVDWLGPHYGQTTFDDGTSAPMIRC